MIGRLALLLLLFSVPLVSAEYLAVTMDVSERDVDVHDVELAFTGSLLSPEQGVNVSLEVIDGSWRSIARSRITASLVSIEDRSDGTSSEQAVARTRTIALVPVTEDARLLIVRGPSGEGQVFDLRAASCGQQPLCEDCIRKYPSWCSSAPRDPDAGSVNIGLVVAIALNALVLSVMAVFLMSRSR